jgi:hypothetical protein
LPNEAVIRPYGIWNAGIIGARGDAAGRVFLRWWAETMSDPRRLRAETGWDQSWLDFAPVFAASLGVIRDPACNVALWNLAERPLSQTGEASWEIATAPLVSFHFSCFDEFEPERFKRAHITSSHPVSPALVGLGKNYAARIQKARDHFPDLDYRFNKTANGRPINEIQRELLIDQWDKLPQDADPFAANWCLPGDKLPLADRAEAKIRHRRLTAHLKRAARGMASKILG